MTIGAFPVTTANALLPVLFDAPLANPSPVGLYAVTAWSEETEPLRFLLSGVAVRRFNCGLDDAFGTWDVPWCGDSGTADLKTGTRPDDPDPLLPVTVWAYDECDLTEASREEVDTRVAQIVRLREPFAVEQQFGAQLAARAPASPAVATLAAEARLIVRAGGVLKTPLGNTWVFGAGYAEALGGLVVATTAPYGWRGPVVLRPTMDLPVNTYAAVAERSVVVAVECVAGAASIAAT